MEFRQIYYFLEVEKQRNFSKAAKNLFISQSNVSQQIRSLEEELGVTLFIRDPHKVSLTEDGIRFRTHALEVINAFDNLMNAFNQSTEKQKTILKVGVFPFYRQVGIASVLIDFYKTNANVLVSTRMTDNYGAYDAMDDGSISFAILKLRPEDRLQSYTYIPLIEENLVALMNKNNPHAGKSVLTAEDLHDLPLLTAEDHTNLSEDMEKIYLDYNLNPTVQFRNTLDTHLLTEMLLEDIGITFATPSTARAIVSDEITPIPLARKIAYNTYLVYPKARRNESIYRKFIDFVVDEVRGREEELTEEETDKLR